jgi:hypothetical protein
MKNSQTEHTEIMPSTLETIDSAILDWIDKDLNLHCNTNKGYRKCQVMWVTPERAYQIKENQTLRDNTGAIILPLITIERTSVDKGPDHRGGIYGQIPELKGYDPRGGAYMLSQKIIKQDKTANFANAEYRNGRLIPKVQKNKKVVYETLYVPMPVYINVNYEVTIITNYQQQTNELSEPFITTGASQNRKVLSRDGHFYEVFIDGEFSTENNLKDLGEEERLLKTTISLKTLGYLLENKDGPLVTRRENVVEYKFPKEQIILS